MRKIPYEVLKMAFLPRTVLLHIFSFCTPEELISVIPKVCSQWSDVSRDKSLWKGLVYEPGKTKTTEEIVDVLIQSPNLMKANFGNVSVQPKVLETLIANCKGLTHLDVSVTSYNRFRKTNKKAQFPNVRVLALSCHVENPGPALKYARVDFPQLEDLEFVSFRFSKRDIVMFLKQKQHLLRTLGTDCSTKDEECIIPLLSECSKLKTLRLGHVCNSLLELPLDKVQHLRAVTSLSVLSRRMCSKLLMLFPNLTELNLIHSEWYEVRFVTAVAHLCPLIRKLTVFSSNFSDPFAVEELVHFKRLNSLGVYYNNSITDDDLGLLRGLTNLTHLALFSCLKLTADCWKVIGSLNKLQVFKTDLYKPDAVDLIRSYVKNRGLHLLFYNKDDLSPPVQLSKVCSREFH